MSVRVATRPLLGLLTDLARTADAAAEAGALGAVLLCTGRGYHGTEPGRVELLGGMSTDRRAMAYAHLPCVGQLPGPVLVSLRDLRNVVSVFKAAAGRDTDNRHAVELEITGEGEGDVIVREDPNLLDDGVSLRFGSLDLAGFPARTIVRVVSGASWPDVVGGRCVVPRDGRQVLALPRVDVLARALAPFAAVGKRRGAPLQLFTRHHLAPVLLQVGDSYRGAAGVWIADDDTPTDLPDVEMETAPDVDRWWPQDTPDEPARDTTPAGLFAVDDPDA
jgi:S-DNA-T family DNA segregation ATPase FtsK/SpoIIIE